MRLSCEEALAMQLYLAGLLVLISVVDTTTMKFHVLPMDMKSTANGMEMVRVLDIVR
jgi:hypothetical protein